MQESSRRILEHLGQWVPQGFCLHVRLYYNCKDRFRIIELDNGDRYAPRRCR